ncbi:MAG: (2Fe-2S)-binding protein [Chloroflexi bacterium]|nr:(2Fe-2S)-binding protein [Chloroflexota bacterium]
MELTINGVKRTVSAPESRLLLHVLREDLEMTGTKFGCGAGICGACTVMVDGVATRSCITPISTLAEKSITTIEGLADGERLHPVQQAFIDAQVPQCGWCMSGQIMTAAAFLASNASPSGDDISEAMSNNYCRCGCYHRIRIAVATAARTSAANEVQS